jgi:hypothetical protein
MHDRASQHIYTVRIRRVHDSILMEDAMTGNFTDGEIQAINRCRLYLQVECLSDICTAAGSTTDPGLQAQPPRVISQSTIKGLVKGFLGSARGQCGDSSSNRIRVIPRAIDCQTLGPWKGLTSENGLHTTTPPRRCSASSTPRCNHNAGYSSTKWKYAKLSQSIQP